MGVHVLAWWATRDAHCVCSWRCRSAARVVKSRAITLEVAQKFFDDFSFLISIAVPILLKNIFTSLSGGQIGTGPFLKEINGSGIALTIFAFFLTIFFN